MTCPKSMKSCRSFEKVTPDTLHKWMRSGRQVLKHFQVNLTKVINKYVSRNLNKEGKSIMKDCRYSDPENNKLRGAFSGLR